MMAVLAAGAGEEDNFCQGPQHHHHIPGRLLRSPLAPVVEFDSALGGDQHQHQHPPHPASAVPRAARLSRTGSNRLVTRGPRDEDAAPDTRPIAERWADNRTYLWAIDRPAEARGAARVLGHADAGGFEDRPHALTLPQDLLQLALEHVRKTFRTSQGNVDALEDGSPSAAAGRPPAAAPSSSRQGRRGSRLPVILGMAGRETPIVRVPLSLRSNSLGEDAAGPSGPAAIAEATGERIMTGRRASSSSRGSSIVREQPRQ